MGYNRDIEIDEKSDSGATIIRHRRGRLDIEVFPDVFVEHTGMLRLDATTLCSNGPGILMHGASPKRALPVAEALRAHGEGCEVVPAEDVISAPDAHPIHSGRLTTSGFRPVDAAGNEQYAQWKYAVALALAHVETTRSTTEAASDNVLTRRRPYVGVGGAAGAIIGSALNPQSRASEKRVAQETFLDILFSNPLRRYRIVAGEFDYHILGDQLQSSSQANIVSLARWFLHVASQIRTNVDAQQLLKKGTAEIPSMSRAEFRDLVDWLLNLAHFGIAPPS